MEPSLTSGFSIVVLQVLWTFRMIYENYIARNRRYDENEEESPLYNPNIKRHVIQLITEERNNARPLCYMTVQEIISPFEEELLRRACAKGVSEEKVPDEEEEPCLPREAISRKSFTNIWLESMTMIV